MNDMEFRACNEEVAAMVAANRRLPRKAVHFLPEEEWTKYQAKLNEKEMKPMAEDRPPRSVKMELAHALLPVCICTGWLLGAREGLVDILFAGVNIGACALWAWVNYKWGAGHA